MDEDKYMFVPSQLITLYKLYAVKLKVYHNIEADYQ